MAFRIIPLEEAATDGNLTFTADLDGVDYQFHFYYNDREGFWYFDFLDLAGNQLRSGVKVVANYPLLALMPKHGDVQRPMGELVCVNTMQGCKDPTLDDFGFSARFGYRQEDSQ